MPALTTKEFTTWANRLANLPWPMTLEEFATTAVKDFGWTATERNQRFSANFSAHSEHILVTKRNETEIRKSYFPLARLKTGNRDYRARLNDLFVSYATAGSEAWGEPIRTEHGPEPLIAWKHNSGCILQIVRTDPLALFTFYTPQGARYYE